MRRPYAVLSVVLLPLAGCAVNGTVATPTALAPASLTGNWQIEAGTPSNPQSVIGLSGALTQTGSQVSATFQTVTICPASAFPIVNFTGTIDSSRNLTLTAAAPYSLSVQLAVPSDPTVVSTGTVNAAGQICALALSQTAFGQQIPPLTGTYTGTAVATSASAPYPTGTVSLVLTQSATANTSGQLPLSGTAAFTSGTCSSSLPVTGTVAGTIASLQGTGNGFLGQPYVTFNGGPAVINLKSWNGVLAFVNGPCASAPAAAIYNVTLTRP